MFKRAKGWFGGLSLLKKVGVSVVSFFIAMTALGMALPPQQNSTTQKSGVDQKQEIIVKTEKPVDEITTKQVTETEVIAFESTTQNDPSLAKGKTSLATAGVNGERMITYSVKTKDGKEIEKTKVSEAVTKPPVTQVTKVGTYVYVAPAPAPSSNCDPNYTPCIPYVSGNTLNCPDIGVMVRVTGTDHNKFDADHDGYGCESYR